jgi:hypothetical protein
MTLVQMLAKACMYAQEHIDDYSAWPINKDDRERLLQCTSFQVACFLAQNTRNGKEGVDWGVIIYDLIDIPMKDEKTWLKILNRKAEDYGGWLVS